MTQERFNKETKYRVAIAAARKLLTSGIISAADFSIIADFFTEK